MLKIGPNSSALSKLVNGDATVAPAKVQSEGPALPTLAGESQDVFTQGVSLRVVAQTEPLVLAGTAERDLTARAKAAALEGFSILAARIDPSDLPHGAIPAAFIYDGKESALPTLLFGEASLPLLTESIASMANESSEEVRPHRMTFVAAEVFEAAFAEDGQPLVEVAVEVARSLTEDKRALAASLAKVITQRGSWNKTGVPGGAVDPEAPVLPSPAIVEMERTLEAARMNGIDFANGDIDALIAMVMFECERGARDDLREMLLQMRARNAKKAAMRELQTRMKHDQAELDRQIRAEYGALQSNGTLDPSVTFEQYREWRDVSWTQTQSDGTGYCSPVLGPQGEIPAWMTPEGAAPGADPVGAAAGSAPTQNASSSYGVPSEVMAMMLRIYEALPEPRPATFEAYLQSIGIVNAESGVTASANLAKCKNACLAFAATQAGAVHDVNACQPGGALYEAARDYMQLQLLAAAGCHVEQQLYEAKQKLKKELEKGVPDTDPPFADQYQSMLLGLEDEAAHGIDAMHDGVYAYAESHSYSEIQWDGDGMEVIGGYKPFGNDFGSDFNKDSNHVDNEWVADLEQKMRDTDSTISKGSRFTTWHELRDQLLQEIDTSGSEYALAPQNDTPSAAEIDATIAAINQAAAAIVPVSSHLAQALAASHPYNVTRLQDDLALTATDEPSVATAQHGTFADITAQTERLQNELDSLSDLSETDALRLQALTDRRAKLLEVLSHLLKKTSDVQASIIGNLK